VRVVEEWTRGGVVGVVLLASVRIVVAPTTSGTGGTGGVRLLVLALHKPVPQTDVPVR